MSFRVWPGVLLRVVVGVFQRLASCVVESGGWVSFRVWPGVLLRVVVGVFQSLAWCVVESGGGCLSESGLVCH